MVNLSSGNGFGERGLKRTSLLGFGFFLSIKLIIIDLDFVGIGKKSGGVDGFFISFEFVGFDVDFIKIEFVEGGSTDILDTEGP